ncbi:hypothetical protein [Psychroserpens luteus]|uniref:YD repeat-containing protein n=1 Tax=Psychroserpens luteus TaxID=1434066 RepID=A0ABW5ZXL5_9FLAO|nr:hypothetical protein [Psychroserpens luteus]
MKFLIIFLLIIILLSCSEEKKTSLQPLFVEYVDDIPYLMTQNQIGSVFEIISYGEIAYLAKNDTLNYYVLDTENRVTQKLKSFMCCSYVYEFDSLGLLKQKRVFTDYPEYFSYDRLREENVIYENQSSNMGTEVEYKYQIENKKIISRVGKIKGDSKFSDSTHYEYSKENKLKTKIRIRLNDSKGEFINDNTITSYVWNQNVLEHVDIKQFLIEDQRQPYFTTSISFDSLGFPRSTVLLIKQDTISKTSIIKK